MRKCIAHFVPNSFRNIGELVPWKQLVEARQTALHASIPWLASCSPCLSVFSTLPTGTHTFMPKNPLTGTITCSKVSLFSYFYYFSTMYLLNEVFCRNFFRTSKSKEKSQLSRLTKMQSFLLCTHFSIFLVKVTVSSEMYF